MTANREWIKKTQPILLFRFQSIVQIPPTVQVSSNPHALGKFCHLLLAVHSHKQNVDVELCPMCSVLRCGMDLGRSKLVDLLHCHWPYWSLILWCCNVGREEKVSLSFSVYPHTHSSIHLFPVPIYLRSYTAAHHCIIWAVACVINSNN